MANFVGMLKAIAEKVTLEFKRPAGTSRGVLTTKNSWIIRLWDEAHPEIKGTGEASIIESLSPDWSNEYPNKIQEIVDQIDEIQASDLADYPSIQFGVEAALLDLKNGGDQLYYPSDFTDKNEGIRINGLIWMGDEAFMAEQIDQKLKEGFSCLKLKIGAIDFDTELQLLEKIRKRYSSGTLELRVDANGAFSPENAIQKLDQLSKFDLHSIEQPIKQGQIQAMHELCKKTPLPIALDEELIGIKFKSAKSALLREIQPQYIILKPSLVGGFEASDEWISLAEEEEIGWWITSALESNVGLNAIAQYTATKNNPMPQGLGTGQLFENNISSTLGIQGERLYHH